MKNGLILPWLNVPGQLEEGHRTIATAFDDMEDEVSAAAVLRSAQMLLTFSVKQGKKIFQTTAVQCYQCFSLRSLLFLAIRAKWLIPNKNKLQW